ncbi:hypothetical protein P9869_23575 [Streptomyces ossamyceticus]|nr:hypothetical protein [Streptomyces ossamyceticus]
MTATAPTTARTGAAHLLTAPAEDARGGPRLLWQPGELGLAQAYVTGDSGLPETTHTWYEGLERP